MTVEEGARYVAAVYAVIMAVLVAYYIISSRRVSALQRDVQLLEEETRRRQAQATEAGAE
ncbi:MAG: hypothetical protein GX624_04580 [Actinobacteria bacterium]|nr:hypothetical protein [Actinomycetota bacterium]